MNIYCIDDLVRISGMSALRPILCRIMVRMFDIKQKLSMSAVCLLVD